MCMVSVSRRRRVALLAAVASCAASRGEAACDSLPFYRSDEVPAVHEINLLMPTCRSDGGGCKDGDVGYDGSFHQLVDNQGNRVFGELSADIVFNGVPHAGGKIQVHGGTPQRGSVDPPQPGTDCFIGGMHQSDPSLPGCKPGFRINFSKHAPLNSSLPVFSFPRELQACPHPDKLVLRNEYADYKLMFRNKLTQDLFTKTGAPALRVEYAKLSVNGAYFGLYAMEEHVDAEFLKCRGLPHGDGDGTVLYKSYPDKTIFKPGQPPAHGSWWDCPKESPEECTVGFEMKLPKCSGCSGEMFSDADPGSCGVSDAPDDAYDQTIPGSCVSTWRQSGFRDPTNPACPMNCSAPTHLAELFGAISKADTTLDELSHTLNVTSYMLWQMVTTFTQGDDTGWHNYYLYRPNEGQPWFVINYDSDNAW